MKLKSVEPFFGLNAIQKIQLLLYQDKECQWGVNIGTLRKLLREDKLIKLLGEKTVSFFENTLDRTKISTELRHDIIHGHHQGFWSSKNEIFRSPEKKFSKEGSYFIRPTARKITIHANKILQAAAIFALIDHMFDSVYNHW